MSLSNQQADEIKSTLINLASINLNLQVDLELDPKWSASESNFRLEIRKHIQNKLHGDPSLLDLDSLPQHQGRYISISHGKRLGGYAYCKTQQVGFDLEETSRIQQPIVFRVCHPQEQKLAIPPSHLWAAKESAFKSAIKDKPRVLSEIKIQSVEQLYPDGYFFKGILDRGGDLRGVTLEVHDLTFAISVYTS